MATTEFEITDRPSEQMGRTPMRHLLGHKYLVSLCGLPTLRDIKRSETTEADDFAGANCVVCIDIWQGMTPWEKHYMNVVQGFVG